MSKIEGNYCYGNVPANASARVFVEIDVDDEVDSDGDVHVSGTLKFYWKAATGLQWNRGYTSVKANGTEIAHQGSWAGYTGTNTYELTTFDKYIRLGTSGGNLSISVSASLSTANASSGAIYTTATSSGSGSFSIGSYEEPIYKSGLSVNTSSVVMGDKIHFTINQNSSGVSHRIKWIYENNSDYTGLTSSGDYTVPINVFEPLMPNISKGNVTFRLETYYGSTYIGSSDVSVSVSVPTLYSPTLELQYVDYIDAVNQRLIANISKFKLYYLTYLIPDSNSASITNVVIKSVTSTNPTITSSMFTLDTEHDCINSTVLPAWEGHSSYRIVFVLTVIDSRGNSVDVTIDTQELQVYCYIPPLFNITSLYRCDKNGVQSVGGTYARLIASIDDNSGPVECIAYWDNTQVNLLSNITSKGENIYELDAILGTGDFDIGTQYRITISYLSNQMRTYGDDSFLYNQLLPTMTMPISLLDDGSMVATSFGEMAQHYEDANSSVVVNFATNADMRATNEEGDIIVRPAYDVLKGSGVCPFPVGSIYLSMLNTNPSLIWENTNWELIATNRMLLGAGGDYEAGIEGGSLETGSHTLTIAEIPPHSHTYSEQFDSTSHEYGDHNCAENDWRTSNTSTVGGGQGHTHPQNLPPFLAVYMWQRLDDIIEYKFKVSPSNIEYNYDADMTWQQFVDSNYNPLLFREEKCFAVIGNRVMYGTVRNAEVYYYDCIFSATNPVVPTAKIANRTYTSDAEGIEWDYVSNESVNEVDILYTTDTHLAWKNSGNGSYHSSQMFTLDNVAYYKDKLWDNNIPAFLVDCGDWVHGVGNQSNVQDAIINFFNNVGTKGYKKYLAVTFGNHEWYAAMGGASNIIGYLNRVNNMTACNLLSGSNTVYKPYRAIKIGGTRIGIISVGYPSPNGRAGADSNGVRSFEGYTFYDSRQTTGANYDSALYTQVQKYIDLLRNKGFNYIIAVTHMDKYSDENFSDDSRFNSRADFLIQNTSGLDAVIPGHWNYPIYNTYSFTDRFGKTGIVVPEAGDSLNSFGRLRLKFNSNTLEAYLLDSLDDLEVI